MFKFILSLAFLIVALLAALFGFLRGMRTKWQLSAMKILTTLIAAILSIFISSAIAWYGSALLPPSLEGVLPPEYHDDIQSLLNSQAVSESIRALVSMIIAPALFLVVFSIVKPLLSIANKPAARLLLKYTQTAAEKAENEKLTTVEEPKPEPTQNSDFIFSVNNEFNPDFPFPPPNEPEKEVKVETVLTEEQKKALQKTSLRNKKITVASSIVGALSGFILFYITSVPLICGTSVLGASISPIIPDVDEEFVQGAAELADALADNAGTVSMKLIGGELIYKGLTTYNVGGHPASLKNEVGFITATADAVTSLTIESSATDGKAVKQALDKVSTAFEKTTIIPSIVPEIISCASAKWDADESFCGIEKFSFDEGLAPISDALLEIMRDTTYDTFKADVSTIFNIVGILSESNSVGSLTSDPLILLSDTDTTAKVFEVFYQNPRFYSLVPAFAECGVELLSDTLGLPHSPKEHYADLTEDLAETVKEFYTGKDGSGADLATLIGDVLEDHGIDATAESHSALAAALGRAGANGDLTADRVADLLSKTDIIIIEADEVTENRVRLSAEVYANKTQLIFTDEIKINREQPADVHTEAALLADAVAKAVSLTQSSNAEDFDTKALIVDFGYLLDCFASTHTFGSDMSAKLLICLLQSETALDTLDMDLITVTHLANTVCDSSKSDSYTVLLSNLVNTIEIIELATKNEDITENVEELIENLTPSTVETLQQVAKPEIMQNYGVPEQSAQKTADLVNNIFTGLVDAKENNTLTEEQYATESKAVADLINIAMNAAKQDTSSGIFGDQSSTGVTASEYIDRIAASQVISQTIIDTVYDEQGNITVDPLETSINLTKNEKAEIVDAMNTHLAGTDDTKKETTQKLLVAAAAIINIDIQINADGTIVLP